MNKLISTEQHIVDDILTSSEEIEKISSRHLAGLTYISPATEESVKSLALVDSVSLKLNIYKNSIKRL